MNPRLQSENGGSVTPYDTPRMVTDGGVDAFGRRAESVDQTQEGETENPHPEDVRLPVRQQVVAEESVRS